MEKHQVIQVDSNSTRPKFGQPEPDPNKNSGHTD